MNSSAKSYSRGEEIANSISHGIGLALSITGLILLIVRARKYISGDQLSYYLAGFIIFGMTMILLYASSTMYHAITNQSVKKVFGILDHCSIYLLIAGTYTPFCLTALRDSFGMLILFVIWTLAFAGVVSYAVFGSKMRKISAITYIPMGLIILFAAKPLYINLKTMSGSNISWYFLVTGGVMYIAGTMFYAMKKIKWMHFVWHIFAIAGSGFHYFSVYLSI